MQWIVVKEAKQPGEVDLASFVPTLNEGGLGFGGRGKLNEGGETMLACECVLSRKWPPALSSSTGGHWLKELNSLGLLIISLRDGIVPQAKRINAGNTPVHMHTATGSQPLTDPHRLKSIELITSWAALAINCLQGQLSFPRHFANFLPQLGHRMVVKHLRRHHRCLTPVLILRISALISHLSNRRTYSYRLTWAYPNLYKLASYLSMISFLKLG